MTVAISSSTLAAITAHAAAAHPNEACGLLLGAPGAVTAAVAAANVAADPASAFDIDAATLLATHRAARAAGTRVVGCYHSHPNGRALPSPRDAAGAAEDGALWLIAAAGAVTAWRVASGGSVHGRFDAVALASG